MSALFHDAWHLATHLDDRLWKTLYTLLLKPGVLTQEYFADHRARYLPPVRLYLVISVLFFALGSSSPHNMGGSSESALAEPPAAAKAISSDDNDATDDGGSKQHRGWARIFDSKNCSRINSDIKWLQQPLRDSCARNAQFGVEPFKHAFFNNVPKMMFVFVPLMALAMMLLYRRPRHYYVEHLVLFLHNHAAVFLILLLETAFAWLATLLGWRTVGQWVVALTCIYAVWYVFRALRVYYGQGRFVTGIKLGVIGLTYFIALTTTLVVTFIVSIIIA
jgi:hypothetical protein